MDATTPSRSVDAGLGTVRPSQRPRMQWDAWGDGSHPARLPAGAKALISAVLPGKAHPVPRLPRRDLVLSPSTMTDDDLGALAAVVGAQHATRDDEVRGLHLGGKSTPDLLGRRSREPQRAPDAVVSPSVHAEVLAVLAACDARGIAVVPFG
ncbi:MAG TPA: FAD-binding oxidoreductase, partial [Microbacterium sp.]|nr:FAD-binding oxidoreductase [Microbacterium sp.]